jgi:hypothetical protein
MSDLSHPHCRKCRQPDYACECDEPDMIEAAITWLLADESIPDDHPFLDNRPNILVTHEDC